MTASLRRTVDPSTEPLTVREVADHLRLADDSAEGTTLARLIAQARDYTERRTRRCWMTQTWREKLDTWPGDCWTLRRGPVQSISSVTYTDSAGASQTVSASDYVLTDGTPAKVRLAYGASWPDHRQQPEAVAITYVAGYASASAVPHAAKAAMLLLIADAFENRGDGFAQNVGVLPQAAAAVDRLLASVTLPELV